MNNISHHFINYYSKQLQLEPLVISAAFKYFAEGAAVPFVARYRRDEVKVEPDILYVLKRRFEEYESLEKVRIKRLNNLEGKNLCDAVLKDAIMKCVTLAELGSNNQVLLFITFTKP